jgi:hypothetical protein
MKTLATGTIDVSLTTPQALTMIATGAYSVWRSEAYAIANAFPGGAAAVGILSNGIFTPLDTDNPDVLPQGSRWRKTYDPEVAPILSGQLAVQGTSPAGSVGTVFVIVYGTDLSNP